MKQSATLDSSFWINSHRAGLLPHVLQRFELQVATAVAIELSERFASGREFWHLLREGAIVQVRPRMSQVKEFGPGERAAINLALEHPDWILLMDDRRPLEGAQRMGLRAICTPVLVVDLFDGGQCDLARAAELLARLAAMQTVIPALITGALAQLAVLAAPKGESP